MLPRKGHRGAKFDSVASAFCYTAPEATLTPDSRCACGRPAPHRGFCSARRHDTRAILAAQRQQRGAWWQARGAALFFRLAEQRRLTPAALARAAEFQGPRNPIYNWRTRTPSARLLRRVLERNSLPTAPFQPVLERRTFLTVWCPGCNEAREVRLPALKQRRAAADRGAHNGIPIWPCVRHRLGPTQYRSRKARDQRLRELSTGLTKERARQLLEVAGVSLEEVPPEHREDAAKARDEIRRLRKERFLKVARSRTPHWSKNGADTPVALAARAGILVARAIRATAPTDKKGETGKTGTALNACRLCGLYLYSSPAQRVRNRRSKDELPTYHALCRAAGRRWFEQERGRLPTEAEVAELATRVRGPGRPPRLAQLRRGLAWLLAVEHGRSVRGLAKQYGVDRATVKRGVQAARRRLAASWDIMGQSAEARSANAARQAIIPLPDSIRSLVESGARDPLIRRLHRIEMPTADIAQITGADPDRIDRLRRAGAPRPAKKAPPVFRAPYPTIQRALTEWLDAMVRVAALRRSTGFTYASVLRRWAYPFTLPSGRLFGELRIDEVDHDNVGAMLRGLPEHLCRAVRVPLNCFYRSQAEHGGFRGPNPMSVPWRRPDPAGLRSALASTGGLRVTWRQRRALRILAVGRDRRIAARARLVLLAERGGTLTDIMRRRGRGPRRVGKWLRRFIQYGVSGLSGLNGRRLLHDVRSLRIKRGLTQHALARSVGVSQAYIAMIERGTRIAPPAILQRLAERLGVTLAALLAPRAAGG